MDFIRGMRARELCETESVLLTFYRKKRNIMDKMLMQGKVAMVTGGGRGIGEASAAVWRTSARRSFWPIWIWPLPRLWPRA